MGNLALAERLLASFEGRFPSEASDLEQSLQARDSQRFVRLAHQLKGAAANISATGLHTIMRKVEEAGREQDWEQVGQSLAELQAEWSRFQDHSALARSSRSCQMERSPAPSSALDTPEESPCAY